ncbi:MAG: peptide chain release factor N(5)-glutamine methyltransferase [Campylobacter sp.]
MNLNEALKIATLEISSVCQNSAKVAKRLLMHHLNASIEWIFLHLNDELKDKKSYFELINRFKNYEPIEYITRKASFYGLDFEVENGVLIPRPETEILVDKALEILADFKQPKIAEIGVGSGIISVLLAIKMPNLKIIATDINQKAINLAKKNAVKFGVDNRIKFVLTSYLDGIDDEFDMIVSNPPYVANGYALDKFVLNEPSNALFGGEIGDEILKNIIKISKQRNIKNLICEIGYDQKKSLEIFLKNYSFLYKFYQDLAGFDRCFVAKLT